MRLFNLTKNKVAIESLKIAETYPERTKGLLGRRDMGRGEGLLIKDCNWIHMFFMHFPIDAIFLKTEKNAYKAVRIIENLKPWRLSPMVFRADSVLEIKSETAKNIISVGDELKITEDL